MPKSKFSAFISLLLVFLSGSLVGAFGYRLYSVSSVTADKQGPPPQRPSPEEFRRRQVADLRQKVGLDDQQVAEYNKILDNTRQQFDQLHDRMNAEGRAIHDQQVAQVNAILKPEQKPLYDKWRAEREAERKRHQQERDSKKK